MPRETSEPSDQERINCALTRAHSFHDTAPEEEAMHLANAVEAMVDLEGMRERAAAFARSMRIAQAVQLALHGDEIRAIHANLQRKGIVAPSRSTEDAVASPGS